MSQREHNIDRIKKRIIIFSLMILLWGSSLVNAQEYSIQEFIRMKVEYLREFNSLKIGNADVAAVLVIPELYEKRNFEPAWSEKRDIKDLLRVINEIEADGLNPVDYHLKEIESFRENIKRGGSNNIDMLASFDILLTDALARVAYHLIFGKVDPEDLDPNWNIDQEIDDLDPALGIQRAIDSPSLYQYVENHKPQHHLYNDLKNGLSTYRKIKDAGGWPQLSLTTTFKKGISDEQIPKLKKRLTLTNDLSAKNAGENLMFDDSLEEAVKSFQTRHGLNPDGIVGKNTLEVLNVSVEERINQIRINLERARWVLHEAGQELVVVNIAAFEVYYTKDRKILWESRAQVGKPYRQTPVFKSKLKYLVFNPTWTVPPTILKKDLLPAVQRDHSYLKNKNISVIDRKGKPIDQNTIDWTRYTGDNFPHTLRQEPGPTNALGRVKFIFPNQHFVYLHDTPSKTLFDQDSRAFS